MAGQANYRVLIRQGSIALFVILAFYLALIRPLSKQQVNLLQEQIEETVSQLEKYMPRDKQGYLPKEEFVQDMRRHLALHQQNYQELKKFIDPPKNYLPKGTQEAGLYFIEQLHITIKHLRRQATTAKIRIPENFGFSEEMPQDSENVELLLKELDVVDRVTGLLIEEGVEEILLVKPLSPVEQRDHLSEKLFYQELPVQLSFLCNNSTLVKFLYQLKNFSPALIVKDVMIKRGREQSLQVEMLVVRAVVS